MLAERINDMKFLKAHVVVLVSAIAAAVLLWGCSREPVERVEWPVMGTIAAVQVRGGSAGYGLPISTYRKSAGGAFAEVERLLNAHDAESEISRLAPLDEEEILVKCDPRMKPCYEAAFKLMRASGGAFNPRWKGPGTLDLGAIAKGFAVDLAAESIYVDGNDVLLDLGGNLKALEGEGGSHKPWKTGVKDPDGGGFAAVADLREGEALATSATYYRGSHIYDGRTGRPVSNDVASVTVLCRSAMWADGLSTVLFILGPGEGRRFVDETMPRLPVEGGVSVLWLLSDGSRVAVDADGRFR